MFEKIVNLILDYVEPEEEITLDSGLRSDLELNSFDLVCFCADLEGAFGVVVTSEDIRNCETVKDLIKVVEKKQAE